MDYADLTQAALDALRASTLSATTAQNRAEAQKLRGRITGVLIRLGRLAAQRSVDDCAEFMRVDAKLIEAWEFGRAVPSLPQLEGLASYLRSMRPGEEIDAGQVDFSDGAEYALIRQRMIGAKLQLARLTQQLEVDEISRRSGLDSNLIARFEFGEAMIPVNHLCVLAQSLRQDLGYFLDTNGVKGERAPSRAEAPKAASADTDVLRFAVDAKNKAFIRLAMAFRQIDRDDLHRIAEALYNIIHEKRDANGRPPAVS